jgi:DNA-binding IclR family transcriptional regulator
MADKTRYMVPGLKQGIQILRLYTPARLTWTAPDLARHFKWPRATVYRLLLTLESLNLLQRSSQSGHEFSLGTGVLGLGFQYLSGLDLVESTRPHLEQLRDETACSVHLAIYDRGDVLYVARYAGSGPVTANIGVGTRLPAYALGLGRLFLMDFALPDLQALYRGRAFERFTGETPADVSALWTKVIKDRQKGYIVSRSFFAPGIVAISAPVRDGSNRVVAAISVTNLDTVVPPGALEGGILRAVLRTANRISEQCGGASQRAPRNENRANKAPRKSGGQRTR